MKAVGRGAAHNPFSSERVRPGTIPYLSPHSLAISDLVDTLERNRFQGQIVGPHGTGKSTLLASLADELDRRGHPVSLREAGASIMPLVAPGSILLLDSAERLSALALQRLARGIRRSGGGIVITAHADLNLPTLVRTEVPLDTARIIVHRLLDGWGIDPPTESEIAEILDRHHGNMRLTLLELYDWYEERDAAG